jgi:hypothetical protein
MSITLSDWGFESDFFSDPGLVFEPDFELALDADLKSMILLIVHLLDRLAGNASYFLKVL